MSVTTWTKSWSEWKLYGPGYGWSTWYIATATITVTRTIGSDTATVKIDTSMTTTSGDTSLGPWQCVVSINGATSGGGEKVFDISAAGLHVKNTAYTKSQTYTVGVGVSSGTLSGTIKFHEDGYPGYQGEYSPSESWSLTYESKGTPSQATWSNYYWGKSSTITIQRTVPDFKESVYLVWTNDTSNPVPVRDEPGSATTVSYTIPYNKCPTNAKTLTAKLRIVTYNGGTQVGTWESGTYTVGLLTGDTTYLPTLTAEPVCEAYNDVVAALGTDTAVAQYSKLNVKAASNAVSKKYNATVVSRVVTFGNGSSASADQTNHISSLIQAAGTISWTYTVTDSRGYTVTRSGTYTVINSSAPSITNVTVYRGDSGGTAQEGGAYIYATATASCESLGGHNSVTLKGKVDSGAYQSMTSGTRKTLKSDADANTQYLVTLTATDILRPTSQTILLPSLDCPLDIPETKHAVGIGMQAQASDDTFYVGYGAKFYGDIIKHDSVNNRDIDLVRTTDSLVGGAWTEIPASANLNTETYIAVGKYFCGSDVTAATLSNCPTGNAFYMSVRNVTKPNADISAEQLYFVREILTYLGDRYIQNVSHASGGTNTYGNWYRLNKTIASESGNAAEWLKAQVYRPSSLDFQHIYDDSRVHSRLDISSSALSGGVNSIFGEGFVLTFMWDNSGSWDTQLYLPDSFGNAPGFRTHNHSTNQWSAVTRLCTDKVTKTEITNLTIGSPHASYGGCYYEVSNNLVHVHMGVSGLTAGGTSGQTVYTMPSGYRPSTVCVAAGIGSNRSYYSNMTVDTSGNVSINSQSTYAECDIWYFI